MKKIKNQHGLTLIELMLASALGVTVLLAVGSALSAMNMSNKTQIAQSETSMTASYAYSYIGSKIRNSSASGCESPSNLTAAFGSEKLIWGPFSSDLTNNLMPGSPATVNLKGAKVSTQTTDTFSTTYAGERINVASPQMIGVDVSQITLESPLPAKYQSPNSFQNFLITDCKFIETFIARINSDTSMTPRFVFGSRPFSPETAIVAPLYQLRFSVGVSNGELNLMEEERTCVPVVTPGSATINGNDRSCRAANAFNPAQPLLPGIELMRIVYGVDTADTRSVTGFATASEFVPNGGAIEVSDILTMTVYFLVKTEGDKVDVSLPVPYDIDIPQTNIPINGVGSAELQMQTLSFTDRIPRRVFAQTFTIRNRAGQ